MKLTTAQLRLRDLTHSDLDGLAEILQDSQAMTAYEGPFTDAEVVDWLNRQLDRYAEDGLGLLAVVLPGTGQLIGQCGLTWQNIDGVRRLEVGYLLNRAFWHRGYAIEAATAMVDWAFTHLDTNEVWAQIRDTNLASINVAIRLGMTARCRFIKHYRGVDMPHFGFAITRDEWCHSQVGE